MFLSVFAQFSVRKMLIYYYLFVQWCILVTPVILKIFPLFNVLNIHLVTNQEKCKLGLNFGVNFVGKSKLFPSNA